MRKKAVRIRQARRCGHGEFRDPVHGRARRSRHDRRRVRWFVVSQIADFFSDIPVVKQLLGPNITHLRTDTASLAHHLPVPKNIAIGIIVGGRFKDHGYNPFIKGDNDGFLSPDRARLGTEKEITYVTEVHFWMELNTTVHWRVIGFLRNGTFLEK
jgi:hypothetical protein